MRHINAVEGEIRVVRVLIEGAKAVLEMDKEKAKADLIVLQKRELKLSKELHEIDRRKND